jgi:tRNA (guanine10-N2)-methyltransferase
MVAEFPSEAAASAICDRAILIKSAMEIWASAPSYEELEVQPLDPALTAPHMAENKSWALMVDAFGLSLSNKEQELRRRHLRHVEFKGEVRCKDPDTLMWVHEQHPVAPAGSVPAGSAPSTIYFGRQIARATKGRKLVSAHDLKKRAYLGPTSMDNELSLVMANMGLVKPGSVVLDPFVGTGSILVACAKFGASVTVGFDIDVRVLRGKGGNTLFTNFEQYGLPLPEVIRCDSSMHSRHFRTHPGGTYDAIVCDPPYGIRAGARKAGSRHAGSEGPKAPKPISAETRLDHIPQTQPYPVEDVLTDLLDLAARNLVLKGRLVYLLPSTYDLTDEDLPRHPCLGMVANSEQPLNQKYGRRLITMEKVGPFQESQKAHYDTVVSSSSSRPFSKLREKMEGDALAGSLDRREAGREAKRQKVAQESSHDEQSSSSSSSSSSSAAGASLSSAGASGEEAPADGGGAASEVG